MSFQSLRDFITFLEKKKELIRIKTPVSPVLELTEIQKRVIEKSGPALLFENVQDDKTKFLNPVLTNLFGTVDRIALGLGTEKENLREIGKLLAFLRQPKPPKSVKETIEHLPIFKKLLSMKPKTVSKAPVQEIVLKGDDIDLNALPIQSCWPHEPAPLITWPLVVTQGPHAQGANRQDEDDYNMGIYRMQVIGKNKTIMRWLRHRGGALQFERWKKEKGTDFPVAAVIGCDPGTILSAVTPIPDTVSEYAFAGLLRNKKIDLVSCKTIPLKVPAHAEIVLEGTVSCHEEHMEGPYGDHTGYYNSVEKFPVFNISAITMRKGAIYQSTYTGRPPDEPSILGEALNEIFVPLLQQQFPEIVDFWLPPEGCSYRMAVVSINKRYPGHAKRIMMAVWSYLRQFMYTKWVIVVDDDIDVRNWQDVIWAITTRMDPSRDMTFIDHTPIDYLDFSSPENGLGSKVGLDATNKWPPETKREWGKKIEMEKEIIDLVTRKWGDYGIK